MQSEKRPSGRDCAKYHLEVFKMPSLLKKAALAALAGSGGNFDDRRLSGRNLAVDLTMTPCTHNICGRKLLADPAYTTDSETPGGIESRNLDVNGVYDAAPANSVATITREGDDMKVTVEFSGANGANHKCTLGVDVVHNKVASDATLKGDANLYDSDAQAHTGATTLATPSTVPDCGGTCANMADYAETLEVSVGPSTYPHHF